MKARGSANRSSEHGFRTPAKKFNDFEPQDTGRQFYYVRLMQVSLRHTYYNRSDDQCPDFTTYPTRYSQALMKNLGLIFKDEGTSFSILYDVRRTDSLIKYLKRQEWPEGSGHCWTRLSFLLSLNNPYFLNFTDVPLSMNPVNLNFYFTNQRARRQQAGHALLDPGEPLMVIPIQLGIDVTDRVKEVEVQSVPQVEESLHGVHEAVICKPRCVPVKLFKDPGQGAITCEQARDCKGPLEPTDPSLPITKCECTNRIYLDFSTVPEDKYTIKQVLYPSKSKLLLPEQPVLYTESYPVPFCFVNLFLTSPTGEKPDLFPVHDLFDDQPKINSITYDLGFERRSTYWNYFVVPAGGEPLENLKIEGEPGISFRGPCSVVLPDFTKAYRFVSRKPLPFMEQSSFRFRLKGEIGTTNQDTTLVERLPVASAKQVLQDELTACLRLSGTIAAGAKGDCRKIQTQACRCVCRATPLSKCLKMIKQICADPQSRGCQEIKLGCSKIYSDTYVYV
jgi:hypothetical protein